MHYWPSGLCEYIRAAEQIEFHAHDDHLVKKKSLGLPSRIFHLSLPDDHFIQPFYFHFKKIYMSLSVYDSVWFTSANANAVSDYNLLFSSGP